MKPTNIKGANAKIDMLEACPQLTMHNLLFCSCLVGSSVRSKQVLCFVHSQDQRSKQKHSPKNIVGFHKHSPV